MGLPKINPNPVPIPLKPASPGAIQLAPKAPKAAATPEPDLTGRAFLLQPWITIRGSLTSPAVSSVTQDDALWMDLRRFADAGFWVDVSGVTNPSGTGATVFLNLEGSPTLDEQDFRPIAPPLALSPRADGGGAVVPLFTKTVRTPSTVPLSRYTRWRLSATGTSGVWDASFRIRGVGGYSRFWVPTDIAGCNLWLRADLGITINSANGHVSLWSDQSGHGHDASQSTAGNQPPLDSSIMNGFPSLLGDGGNYYMTTGAFTFGSDITLVAATLPTATTQVGAARILETHYDTSYYLGSETTAHTTYQLIVNNSVAPYGNAKGGAITLSPTIVAGTYSSTTTKGRLYVNGSFIAEDTFTAPTPNPFSLSISRDVFGFGQGWKGYLAEVLVYTRALSATEFALVHRYLGARYGVVTP